MPDFALELKRAPIILTEGSVVERLRRHPGLQLNPDVAHAGFLYDPTASCEMAGIWREYLSIGRSAGLPMLILTPTWRANPERLKRAGMGGRDVNGDAVRHLAGLRAEQGPYARRIFVGGLLGCRGDCYLPGEALAVDEAEAFHTTQIRELARAGADFLFGSTLPALSEARGMAQAMADCGLPYILSFVVTRGGTLLDGTPLGIAIRRLDGEAAPAPLGYMANCVHTSILAAALGRLDPALRPRVLGLQANTSTKTPTEFDGLSNLDTEPPGVFAEAMQRLQEGFGLKILGGCCGTNGGHIRALAERLTPRPAV